MNRSDQADGRAGGFQCDADVGVVDGRVQREVGSQKRSEPKNGVGLLIYHFT